MSKMKHLLIGLLVFTITACGSGSGILKKDVNKRIALLGKRDIRCYVVQQENNVLVSAVLEGCKQVFTLVESRPYEIKVNPEFGDYKMDTIKERFKVTGGNIECEGTYRIGCLANIEVYDSNNRMIQTIKKADEITVETYAFALKEDGKNKARSRAHRNAAGKANTTMMNRILPEIILEIYSDENVIAIEENKRLNPKSVAKSRTREHKVPFTCVLALPAGFEFETARALFERSLTINKERQAGATEVVIGNDLKNALVEKLEHEFSQVQVMGLEGNSLSATYNPHNVTCIIKLDYQNTVVESKNNSVTINASATFETATGEVYKTANLTGQGTSMLKDGGGFLSNVMLGVSLTRLFTEGYYVKKALKNGCNEAIRDTTERLVEAIDPEFIASFSEFSAYAAAKKSRSSSDILHFLSLYPQSNHAGELKMLHDNVLYEFAIGSDSIEGYTDYLDQMPNGKHRAEAKDKLAQLVYNQIVQGNTAFCQIYMKYSLGEADNHDIKKACFQN